MTLYSVKINKHETVKTTALHKAINLAKKALIDKLVAKGLHPTSVSEKMYLDTKGRATYRVFAIIHERNWNERPQQKILSNSVRMENIPDGGYNFELHKEITNAIIIEAKKNENC